MGVTPFLRMTGSVNRFGDLIAHFGAPSEFSYYPGTDDDGRFHLDCSHLVDAPLCHIEPFLEHRRKDFVKRWIEYYKI